MRPLCSPWWRPSFKQVSSNAGITNVRLQGGPRSRLLHLSVGEGYEPASFIRKQSQVRNATSKWNDRHTVEDGMDMF
jgi:hypothetical protein